MKEVIPGFGEKTTKQRIQELEKRAATLPVIFALLFTEALKGMIDLIVVPFITVPSSIKFLIAALVVGMLYIYGVDGDMYAEKAKEGAGKSKEKAQDIAKDNTD